jgi:hypothetical protein
VQLSLDRGGSGREQRRLEEHVAPARASALRLARALGRGSNQGNTQNEKSIYHQSSIDFRCYLEMALSEPRLPALMNAA